ncbi:MAG: fatty acid oxidation complex subunit alpha FadJ [Algiphilus sp.]|nr:fatty acid oxidation complex subunit alpha FadJ [Algiphilus sp.]
MSDEQNPATAKGASKKTATKKTAAKKSTAKKATVKKAAVKKVTAKKAVPAKKAATKAAAGTGSAASGAGFTFRREGDIGLVEINVPGDAQNTLKAEFAGQFEEVMRQIERNGDLKGVVVISTKPGSFVAGADITMFDRAKTAEEVEQLSIQCQAAFQQFESLRIPVVAAIDGACLGGGLELALACHARIATDAAQTKLGLPECMLGLLPAGGGTQRLPRLIGIANSLDLLLTGKEVRPAKARKLGIVDEVVHPGVLKEAAIRKVHALASGKGKAKASRLQQAKKDLSGAVTGLALEDTPGGRLVLFRQARKQLLAKTGGNYPAQERILDVVALGFSKGLDAGYAAEAKAFGELAMTDVSRQLRGIFFAQNALKKETFVPAGVTPRKLEKVGVLGAGLMGAGIALVSANKAGLNVRLKDRDDKGLGHGFDYLNKFYGKRVKRGAMRRFDADAELRLVTGGTGYQGMRGCDVVVEAVFEDLDLKHRMIADVEAHCGPETIFASNTSSIPITDLAKGAKRPENVIGMHYFSPVEKMPLLEIITHAKTADAVTATAVALGKAQGKTVIVVKDGPGFYTTRVLAPYLNEAARILGEGVDLHAIDKALTAFGYPVGPIALMDEVGIDVGTKVAPVLEKAFGERMQSPKAASAMIEAGYLGRKTGRGFYVYDAGKKGSKPVNDALYELLNAPKGTSMAAGDIVDRCNWMLVNEAVYCLQEGIIAEPMHGDIGAIFGLGFPPFRGGPFRFIDEVGAVAAVRSLERLAERHGARFEPAPLLRDYAKAGKRFHG